MIYDEDDGEVTIGEKRNRLLDASSSDFVCYIDDDDTVSDDYLDSLVSVLAAHSDCDCLGFKANWYIDGRFFGECSYTLKNQKRQEVQIAENRWRIERQPGHLTPIRRQIATAIRFQPWNHGEDAEYSIRLRAVLKPEKEIFIDAVLYHYWLRSQEARLHEKVHPQRWNDNHQRIEIDWKKRTETRQTVPLDTDR